MGTALRRLNPFDFDGVLHVHALPALRWFPLGYTIDMRRMLVPMLALSASAAFSQPQYEVVDLTAIYGQGFEAVSINDSGVIAGNLFGRACVADGGKLTMLPKWKGEDWRLLDFGNNGDAIGRAYGGGPIESVYFDAGKGTVVDMGIEGPGTIGAVQGINSVGQATGQSSAVRAFVWEQGQPLQVLEPHGAGFDLNDSATVVGVGGGLPFAARWIEGKYQNLHPAWAETSEAVAVNNLDEGVGRAWAPGIGYRALLWRDGLTVDLGDLGGGAQAHDINEFSQVVGVAFGHGPSEGYLWEMGTMHRLEDLVTGGTGFVVVNAATSINSSGQLLATGFTGSFNNSLLFQPVPEPATGIVLTGLCFLICVTKVCRGRRQGGRHEDDKTERGDHRMRIDS